MITSSHSIPGPSPELALEILDAVARREWERIDRLTAPDIRVEVHADPTIRTRRNEHVWRSVTLQGRQALFAYLAELQVAAPALAVLARSQAQLGDHDVVRADCAGVDSAGSPFDAETDFAVWVADGRVQRVEASINGLAVGVDVLRRGEGDPRKYFTAFLSD